MVIENLLGISAWSEAKQTQKITKGKNSICSPKATQFPDPFLMFLALLLCFTESNNWIYFGDKTFNTMISYKRIILKNRTAQYFIKKEPDMQ